MELKRLFYFLSFQGVKNIGILNFSLPIILFHVGVQAYFPSGNKTEHSPWFTKIEMINYHNVQLKN